MRFKKNETVLTNDTPPVPNASDCRECDWYACVNSSCAELDSGPSLVIPQMPERLGAPRATHGWGATNLAFAYGLHHVTETATAHRA